MTTADLPAPKPAEAPEPTGRWWVSWYTGYAFEYYGPWWFTGFTGDGRDIFCAAVVAADSVAAEAVIRAAHDDPAASILFRFVSEKPADWSPFCDRFQRASWMRWPEVTS